MEKSNYFSEVRLRYAPSPTGYLHVGGARTALYNFLYAKKHGGKFILRIEDTDQERSTMESLKMVLSDMKWLGLTWDEGPNAETLEDMGSYGPYKQSERLSIYNEVAQDLLKRGLAYYCFMTDEEIEQQRQAQTAEGAPHPRVESPFENMPLNEAETKIKAGGKAVVRFKTRHLRKDYHLKDLIRGDVHFPSDMVGDFVLLRSDGMPVYNFCCVVDDYKMKISHVLRAEEHLSNSLRQLMIYEAMNWPTPQFGHVSLVLDDDRQKLSKRKGATSCDQFRSEGYLPEALLNFVALLGWSHPEEKEILSMQEMIDSFSTDRLHSSGAVFDRVKLKWFNAQHLRAKAPVEMWGLIEPFLKANDISFPEDRAWKAQSMDVFKNYLEIVSDAVPFYKLIDDKYFEILPESSEVLAWPTSRAVIQEWQEAVKAFPESAISEADFMKLQDIVKEKSQTKGKNLFQPMRVAVIGKPHGTELKILVPLMKKESLIKRAQKVLESM
jgi:nondiscriminating glutamyl-tRNA synthetase